jgi:hypothetical protein
MAGAALDTGSVSELDAAVSLSLAGAGVADCVLAGAVLAGGAFGRPLTLWADPEAAASTTAPRIKKTPRFGMSSIVPKNSRLALLNLRRFSGNLARSVGANLQNGPCGQCARKCVLSLLPRILAEELAA